MKYLIGLLFCLGLIIQTSHAQDFQFGFHMSPSLSWLSTDDNQINRQSNNFGFRLGMIGEYYFRDNYAIVSGVGFAFNQGGTIQHERGGRFWTQSELSDPSLRQLPSGTELTYKVQYVEIPVSLKMRTNEFGYLRYFAEIPLLTIGFNSQARGDINADGATTEKENINKDVNLFSLAWGVGLGLEYSLHSDTKLVGGVYFRQGFLDVTDDSGQINLQPDGSPLDPPLEEDSKGTIGSLTLRIGVMF